MKKYYDYIMSIGQGCVTPMILRDISCRRFAGPLDWTFMDNYVQGIDIVKNRFDDYFNKEGLEFAYYENSTQTNVYKNKRNFIRHIHCFPPQNIASFDEIYPKVYEKYQRRICRFLDFVGKKKNPNVLLLYIERAYDDGFERNSYNLPIDIDNKIIEKDIEKLNKVYGKECFEILYVKHDETLKMNIS